MELEAAPTVEAIANLEVANVTRRTHLNLLRNKTSSSGHPPHLEPDTEYEVQLHGSDSVTLRYTTPSRSAASAGSSKAAWSNCHLVPTRDSKAAFWQWIDGRNAHDQFCLLRSSDGQLTAELRQAAAATGHVGDAQGGASASSAGDGGCGLPAAFAPPDEGLLALAGALPQIEGAAGGGMDAFFNGVTGDIMRAAGVPSAFNASAPTTAVPLMPPKSSAMATMLAFMGPASAAGGIRHGSPAGGGSAAGAAGTGVSDDGGDGGDGDGIDGGDGDGIDGDDDEAPLDEDDDEAPAEEDERMPDEEGGKVRGGEGGTRGAEEEEEEEGGLFGDEAGMSGGLAMGAERSGSWFEDMEGGMVQHEGGSGAPGCHKRPQRLRRPGGTLLAAALGVPISRSSSGAAAAGASGAAFEYGDGTYTSSGNAARAFLASACAAAAGTAGGGAARAGGGVGDDDEVADDDAIMAGDVAAGNVAVGDVAAGEGPVGADGSGNGGLRDARDGAMNANTGSGGAAAAFDVPQDEEWQQLDPAVKRALRRGMATFIGHKHALEDAAAEVQRLHESTKKMAAQHSAKVQQWNAKRVRIGELDRQLAALAGEKSALEANYNKETVVLQQQVNELGAEQAVLERAIQVQRDAHAAVNGFVGHVDAAL